MEGQKDHAEPRSGVARWRPSLPAPSGTGLSWWVAAFTLSLLLVIWGAIGLLLWQKHREALSTELRQNANLAGVLEEQTLRVIAAVDQATLRVRAAVVGQEAPDMVRFANETGLAPQILTQLSLIDETGAFAGSNLDPDGTKSHHVDLSSREHVKVHLGPPDVAASFGSQLSPDGLFIGKPVLGKVSHKWTIQLSRKITDPAGRALGVVVASLDPTYFEGVYRSVNLSEGGSVALVGTDLQVRARVVDKQASAMGAQLAAGSAIAGHLGEAQANYLATGSLDGSQRNFAVRRIADYPLYVSVSTRVDSALASWRATRDSMVAVTAAFSLVVLMAAVGFVLGLRRLERTHEALRRSEAQANAANDAKTAFLTAMSHELRTPLTSIRGFAELMEQRLDQPRFRAQAGLIRKAAEYLNTLLTEILDIAKIEAGELELVVERHDPHEIVAGAVDFYALNAAEKGLTLTADIAADVPRQVGCDSLRLKQILNNLLSNAVKFTSEGGVQLSVDYAPDVLQFHVHDTGPGIAKAHQEVIFQKFRQADARVSYEHGGTGLGLALSRSLASLMGGSLTVVSTVGVGSRFTLTLPVPPQAA